MFSVADVVVGDSLMSRFTSQISNLRENRDLILRVGGSDDVLPSRQIESWEPELASGYVLGLPKLLSEANVVFAEELVRRLNTATEFRSTYDWRVSHGNLEIGNLNFYSLVQDLSQTNVRVPDEFLLWLGTLGSFKQVNQHAAIWTRDERTSVESGNLLLAAWNLARDRLLSHSLPSLIEFRVDKDGSKVLPAYGILNYAAARQQYLSKRPDRAALVDARNEIVSHRLAISDAKRSKQSRSVSEGNFVSFWNGMKKTIADQFVNADEVNTAFGSIPLLPAGTASSRTWGIEIEVVAAGRTSRPPGWDERGDGSLSPAEGGECECGCDDCCEYDNHCGYDDCEGADTAEFVSPILSSFNSAGVQRICNDLVGAPCNNTPGIHIHVGADDLTAGDVARLSVAYSAISPFLEPLLHRESRNYCRDITAQNIKHWLNQTRRAFDQRDKIQVAYDQPDDRYHDLNLQSLRGHGTIEFRALGPIYDYEHIVRWAWLCRELTNVSKLNLPQTIWTSVRSMADVVKILRTYGKEQVPEGIYKLYTKGDNLDVEYTQESNRRDF